MSKEYKMPWKQEKPRNVCYGCEERCKLDIEVFFGVGKYGSRPLTGYVPVIGGVVIRYYLDESGNKKDAKTSSAEQCANQLHYLCTLCDNYKKTR